MSRDPKIRIFRDTMTTNTTLIRRPDFRGQRAVNAEYVLVQMCARFRDLPAPPEDAVPPKPTTGEAYSVGDPPALRGASAEPSSILFLRLWLASLSLA